MNSHPSRPLTAILGGGISGLACAFELLRRGQEVLVLDRRTVPGGRIQTEQRDGFLVEQGPNSMIAPAPGTEALIHATGLEAARIDKGDGVRHRYLVRDGKAKALPADACPFPSAKAWPVCRTGWPPCWDRVCGPGSGSRD